MGNLSEWAYNVHKRLYTPVPGAHEPPKERRTPHTRVSGSSMYSRVPDILPYMARGRYVM